MTYRRYDNTPSRATPLKNSRPMSYSILSLLYWTPMSCTENTILSGNIGKHITLSRNGCIFALLGENSVWENRKLPPPRNMLGINRVNSRCWPSCRRPRRPVDWLGAGARERPVPGAAVEGDDVGRRGRPASDVVDGRWWGARRDRAAAAAARHGRRGAAGSRPPASPSPYHHWSSLRHTDGDGGRPL